MWTLLRRKAAEKYLSRASPLSVGVKGQAVFSYRVRHLMADKGEDVGSQQTRKTDFKDEKERILRLPLEEKRKLYKCGSQYVVLDKIKSWLDSNVLNMKSLKVSEKETSESSSVETCSRSENNLASKVSVVQEDITHLEVDAIVNAANKSLLGGGGVDGSIHRAAGSFLKKECKSLFGCETGQAKITSGYNLPCKFVIHTVGPMGEDEKKLTSCYIESLKLLKEQGLKSVAFPCISTGVYGYPPKNAAIVALSTVKKWLEVKENFDSVNRVIFCVFLDDDLDIYKRLMPKYFPVDE